MGHSIFQSSSNKLRSQKLSLLYIHSYKLKLMHYLLFLSLFTITSNFTGTSPKQLPLLLLPKQNLLDLHYTDPQTITPKALTHHPFPLLTFQFYILFYNNFLPSQPLPNTLPSRKTPYSFLNSDAFLF